MTVKQANAYEQFIDSHARRAEKSEQDMREHISPEDFETRLRTLHHLYIEGEFTIGKFADLMGVPALNLVDILDALDLPIRHF
jgi:hypothetical protein